MLHPAIDLKLVSPEIGYGVFATQDIPKGTILWALDPLDQMIDQAKAKAMKDPSESVLRRYSWVNGNGDRILCWDFGRFMNHSCEPNSVGPGKLEFEIAVRDIKAGEEVVCDYGSFNLEEPLDCACGSPQCRGTMLWPPKKPVQKAKAKRRPKAAPKTARKADPRKDRRHRADRANRARCRA